MPADSIVETFNVTKHVWLGFLAGSIDVPFDSLLLQAAGEGLGNCIVPTVPSATHTRQQLVVLAPAVEIDTAKLGAPVAFGKRCKEIGVRPSMGAVGNFKTTPWLKVSLPRWSVS